METVNVVDFSQMKDLKELLEEKLSKLQDEITAQEIENVLTQFLKKATIFSLLSLNLYFLYLLISNILLFFLLL